MSHTTLTSSCSIRSISLQATGAWNSSCPLSALVLTACERLFQIPNCLHHIHCRHLTTRVTRLQRYNRYLNAGLASGHLNVLWGRWSRSTIWTPWSPHLVHLLHSLVLLIGKFFEYSVHLCSPFFSLRHLPCSWFSWRNLTVLFHLFELCLQCHIFLLASLRSL